MHVVTGGAGFIGSNLVAALGERGGRVLVSDLVDEAKAANLAKRGPGVVMVAPGDLEAAMARHAGEIEAVFHLGAISSTTETDEDKLRRVNVELSKDLWARCAAAGLPFIYASSASVYGDGAQGFDDNPSPNALAKLKPLNPYGRSKLAFDRWVMDQVAGAKPAPPVWAGLRFFNVYGPNEYHKGGQASVVWHFFRQIRDSGQARLFKSAREDVADGEQKRDFVWVGDCVAAMLWLAGHGAGVSSIYNVGAGEARSFNDLARAIFAAMNAPERIAYVPMPQALREHYQYFTEAQMDRLREAGYSRPPTPLEEGVARYLREFLIKDDPYR